MKKILFLGVILTLIFSASVSAQGTQKRILQQREIRSFKHGDLNKYELRRLHHHEFRHKMARNRAFRDGRISRHERRHLNRMKRHGYRESHRFRHNRFHRAI